MCMYVCIYVYIHVAILRSRTTGIGIRALLKKDQILGKHRRLKEKPGAGTSR